MRVAVLALQGAFAEHEQMLEKAGLEYVEIRNRKDLEEKFDALILPGGESTVMGRLLKELDMYEGLLRKIKEGMPVLGTCAGLILLAERLSDEEAPHFATLPVTVKRNAYGRQLGSFRTEAFLKGIGKIPMEFIRAPYIETVGTGVEVLAEVDGHIVAVRYRNQVGVAFHPELTGCTEIYRILLSA